MLVLLLVMSVDALLFLACHDMIRARLLMAATVTLEKRLEPPVLACLIRRNAPQVPVDPVPGFLQRSLRER